MCPTPPGQLTIAGALCSIWAKRRIYPADWRHLCVREIPGLCPALNCLTL